jgi:hypothetical protein
MNEIRIVAGGLASQPFRPASVFRRAWKQSFGKLLPEATPAEAMAAGWMHLFLWGLNPKDRAMMIGIVLGRQVETSEIAGVPAATGLKGWEDFPDAYPEAPFRIEVRPDQWTSTTHART